MVDSIKIQVALDGSEEVQSQMYKIGAAGRNAFLAIDAAATKLAITAAELSLTFAAIGAVVGVAAASKLSQFANAAEDTAKALTQLQRVSGQSFENLSSLQQVFAAGGTSVQQFAKDFGNLSEKIAAAGQKAAIQRADKDWVDWANDISRVRQQFANLAAGAQVTFSPLTTLDTKVQALLETLAKARPEERFLKLAEVFKNLRSDFERAQIGKALGLSPEEITTLTQGSAAMKQLQAEAVRLGFTLTDSNQQALQQMAAQWNQFNTLLSTFFQKIGALAAPAIATILGAFQVAMQQIITDFQNLPLDQAIAKISSRLAPAFTALGDVLWPILSDIGTMLGNALVDAIVSRVSRGIQNVKDAWSGNAPLSGGAPIGGPGGGIGSNAAGGLLGGRGTGTSDSNLAWVSRGEHIMPAAAVAQPGVLMFLEALRRSGGNLSAVLNGMGRFALGGMVPRAMPAFASGGLAGGMSNVTIAFPGLPPIGGLRASSAVVDELRKSAALAQVRSGGRKPSRYA